MKLKLPTMTRLMFSVAFSVCLPMFVGCPDYSHQREVPDYGSMSDEGGEEGAENETE